MLYVTFDSESEQCSYVETPRGDILRVEVQTGRIVGCTIPFFMDQVKKQGEVSIDEVGAVPFNSKTLDLLHV